MNAANIISLARNQTWGTTTSQISDAQMLIYLNIVYQELFAEIAETDKKLTWQEWTWDLVADQTEYTLPAMDSISAKPWLKRLINIYIKYKSTDDYYTKARVIDYEAFSASNDYLKEYKAFKATENGTGTNRSYPYPFVMRWDASSIFLNPTPNESVTNWLKIQWIYQPLDLTLSSSESDIKLQREYHDLLALGMEQFIRWYRQIDSKRNIAMNRYAVAKQNMLSQQHNVPESASRDSLPDLTYYE